MIDKARFEAIKDKHGQYASWAVWADEGIRAKDNVGDLNIFDLIKNEKVLEQLKPDIVLAGLNISRPIQFPLGNFHDGRTRSMDYKIRFGLKGTPLWGAYMTDVIKDFEQKVAGKLMSYLRKNKAFEKTNFELLHAELKDLAVDKPTLIAFGRDAFELLDRNLRGAYEIWRIPHYSARASKEAYRQQIGNIVKSKAPR